MARHAVIDTDCYSYVELGANRNDTSPGSGEFTELDLIGNLQIDSVAERLYMKLWDQQYGGSYPTNITHNVSFDAVWQPDSNVYEDLQTAWRSREPRAFLLLDGQLEGLTLRCSQSGSVTGLLGDFYVTEVGQTQRFADVVYFTANLELANHTKLEPGWVL